MSIQSIYAEKTVSVTEMRKKPCDYFIDEPVAVLSNNKPAGYMVSADLYEQMIKLLESNSTISRFNVSAEKLENISAKNELLLLSAAESELGEFSE